MPYTFEHINGDFKDIASSGGIFVGPRVDTNTVESEFLYKFLITSSSTLPKIITFSLTVQI